MNLLTIKEAARILKVSEKTLRRWEEKSYITPIRTSGKHRRYSLEQLKVVKKNKNKIKSEVAPIAVSAPIKTKNIGVSNFDNIFKDIEDSKEDVLPKPRTGFRYKLLLSYFIVAGFIIGGLAVYKNAKLFGINQESQDEQSVLSGSDSNQSVLAATSFQNAEFNINVPTTFSSSITVGADTFTGLTGSGLTVVNGTLTAVNTNTLGSDVNSTEIVDGTISEVDLLSSNTPSGSQILSFNSTTGGFTWTNQITDTDTVGTNFFTDSGDITYLTATGDDFAIGGTATTSPFYIDTSVGTISLTKTAAGKWINFSDGTDVWGLYNYAGSPEGNITANTGTLAMDTANGTLYVKTDDSDATGWVNLATGATSPFVQAAGLITLTTTTDNTNFGGSTDLAKLAVDGDTDEIQLLIQGNSTQTSNVVVFENSSGVDLFALSNSGGLTIGSNGVDGTLTLYSEQGATDYSTVFVPGTQTENITYTLPADNGAGANYVLSTDGTGVLSWQSVSGIGGMSSFVLSGDSGSSQTISDSNTLLISGGVNGIDTTTSATDTITLDIDTTEIGENTFGNNTDASIVWTFDQTGVTDPTLTFGDGLISVGGDLAISGGNVTTAVTFDGTLTVTGTTTTNGSLVANGSTTLGDGGDTVVINSSDWDISAVGDLTGIGNITIDGRFDTAAHSNNTGLNLPTSAGAPIAVTGTSEGDIVYDTTNDSLYIYDGGSFTAIGGGGYSGWTLAGDTGTPETISSGNTGNILGGVNGIDTVVSATDTITLNFDATEVGSVTFGSGTGITWTFDASVGTDPTLVFGDNTAALTAGTISLAGNTDITNGADVTGGDLTVGGANFNVAVGSGNITTVGTVSSNVNESINGIDINAGTVSDIVNLTINSGGDLTIGAIGLNDVGTTNITSGASLIGAFDEFTNSASTTVQDVLDDLDAAIGAGASKFTQDTGFVYLTTTTDSVTIGGTTELGKLAVDGNADEIQLLIQGNGTQTANLAVFENSAGTDQLVLTNTGDLTINGDLAVSGGNITSSITFDSDVDLSLAGTENFVITSGAPGADLAVISGGTSTTDGVDGLQLTYGVSAASGNIIDLTPSYADATAAGTSETYNVIDIDAFTATQNAAGDTGLIRAVNIGNLTQTETAGTLTANAIKIGTGWDDILNYNGTTVINGTGQIVSTQLTGTLFTLAGDSGSGTVAQGDTVTIAGGTNGIDTSESGTTVTLNIDATEIGTTTFGSGSGITWTYDASAGTDTTIAFGDNTQTFTTGTATFTGAVAINGNSLTVGSNGTDGALTLFSEMGATDYSVVFQPSNSQTQTTTYTLPIAYAGANDYVLTSSTAGVLSWQQVTAVGGAGDITAIGDITSGAAFTQTAGNDGNVLYLEGTTVDGNEIALTGGDSGSDIVVTIPAIAGTLASLSGTQVFDGIKSFTDAAGITIGLDTTTNTAGLLKLISAGANAFSTIFTTGTQTQDITYTLPLNDGNSDQALVTDGAGVLIWKDIAGVGGVGDITNVGNVTSGEAFTSGTPGTSLYFATGGDINDANGNEVLTFTTTTSAVNELTLANAAANGNVTLSATGGDTDIDIETILKGTGTSVFSSSTTNADKIAIKPQTTTAVSSFTGTITTLNLTGDRTYTLKDADGTIAFTSDIPTSDNYQYWTIDGDDADTEQIGSTNTLLVAGGTNGIDTDVSATDTITLNFDTTEVGTSTFGSGAGIVWTFDIGTTDPTLTFGEGLVTVGGDLAISGGNVTTAVTFDSTATVTGTTTTNGTLTANGAVTLGDNGDTVVINSSDWDINATGDATGIGAITADGAISFTPSTTNDITFNVDTDTLLTLDSSVANADNLVISPNNSGTGATFTGTVTSNNLTADRTWTFQDGDGTIAFLTDIPTSDNYVSWTLAGDTGTPEAIASGNTGSILGGINGIDTAVGATDTLTINLDTTEIGTTTFGSGSSVVWTFDASAGTDTTITFGDNLITLGQGLTTTGILTANGIVTLGDNGDTVNINSSDWDISTTGDATGMGSITGDGDLLMTGGDFTGANSETLDMGETDNGSFIFTAAGETNNESIEFDLETAANTLSIFSSTGITSIDLGSSIFLTNIGNAGTDFTSTGGLTLDDILTVNDDADIAFTGDENLTITDGATPTVDVISIVANGATVTTDANGIELDFTTGDGANVTNSGLQIDMASGGTASGDITNAINLTMDAADASTQRGVNFADNNFDTDINATSDLTLGIGGTNEITLTGTNLAPSTAEGNSLGSATLEWEGVFVGDDAGIKFGLDQDWTMAYDQAGDSRLELTTAGTSGMLIQTANATGTSLNLTTNSLTTGTGFLVDNSANTLTTGTLIQAQSTGTSLTTAADAFLGYFDWTPGSATTASGDLFRINIGANGNVTNVFNVTDAGSSLFRVSESQIESAVPHLFSAVGDVNIAYDLVFTNQTASTIDSYGPLTLRAGESFESNNLTLTSYLNGNILLNTGATTGKVGVGAGITPLGLLTVDSTGTGAIGKAALTVIQDESQDIITASASATTRFTVNSAGNTFVTLRNTATSAVCHVTNGAGYDELTDCLTSVLADYAERYPVANDITYGEIVATGSENVTTTDGQTIKKLVKSNSAYQNNVLGITSDNYGDFTSAGNNINENDNPMPVALSGRVPVKVANSSEPIVSGDFITSSTEEGKAMKATGAGKVIGIALEDWAPNQGKETAMVYVSNFYYTPVPENSVSRDEIENLLRITEQNQVLLEESQNWNTNTATTSGEFSDLVTSNLFVTGIAAFDSLSLTNSLTLNNNLVIGDGNIDSLTTPLNIQGSGAQALNFMAGKVTIDTNGNMVVQGDLKVLGTLDANKVSVSEDVAGTATIIAGANEIIISNENIKTDSLIFVTPTSPTKNSIYVKTQVEGQATIGFDPIIVDEIEIPTVNDIKFNWWIIGKSQ